MTFLPSDAQREPLPEDLRNVVVLTADNGHSRNDGMCLWSARDHQLIMRGAREACIARARAMVVAGKIQENGHDES